MLCIFSNRKMERIVQWAPYKHYPASTVIKISRLCQAGTLPPSALPFSPSPLAFSPSLSSSFFSSPCSFFLRYFTTNIWYPVILPLNNLVYIYFRKNNLFHTTLSLLHVIELAVILWSHLSILRFPWLSESGSRQNLCCLWLLVPLCLF